MKRHEHWNYKHPRTEAQYSHNCWRRREEHSRRLDMFMWLWLAFASGFFIGTLSVKIAIDMVI